jgi:hypothetical protein
MENTRNALWQRAEKNTLANFEKPKHEPKKQEEFERPESEFDFMAMERLSLPLMRQHLHAWTIYAT